MPMPTNGGKPRIWYVVSPERGQWQVTFGDEASPFCYASREEALGVARAAAKLHYEDRGEPAGTRLDLPGEPRQVVATYGRLPHVERRRALS